MNDHPSLEKLLLWRDGCLSDADCQEIEAHLETCADVCQPLLDTVPGNASAAEKGRVGPSKLPSPPGYEILRELGRGGMGVVYQARQLQLNRLVALKMILSGEHAGPDNLARFRTEAEAIARLQHPNIVQVYEVGEQGGRPFFSLEYCPGDTLGKKLKNAPLEPRAAAQLVHVLARAIHVAHGKGIVHRDLKPENVLLAEDGTPKISDFGLAKKLDLNPEQPAPGGVKQGQTESGTIFGTPSYMAPEQARGQTREMGPAVDVYALGSILYECLTGRPPFLEATTLDTILRVIADDPVKVRRLKPKVPADLETICHKCLHKEPGKRYRSALELAEDLQRFLDGRPILARPVSHLERTVKLARRHPAVSALLGIVVLAIVGGVAGMSWALGVALHNEQVYLEEKRKAETEEKRANQKTREANDEKNRANDEAKKVREQKRWGDRLIYAQDLSLAWKAWQDRRLDDLATLLEKQLPVHTDGVDLRGWEWHYLKNQVDAGRHTLKGHENSVWSIAFSPDGQFLITGGGAGRKGELKIWDLTKGQLVQDIQGLKGPVSSVDADPDGKAFLTAGAVWDTPAKPDNKSGTSALKKGQRPSFPISKDGRDMARAGKVEILSLVEVQGELKSWDLKTGKLSNNFPNDTKSFEQVAFDEKGEHFLTLSGDGKVRKWNARSLELLPAFPELTTSGQVAFSPNGNLIAYVHPGSENKVSVWDSLTNQKLATGDGPDKTVVRLAFSRDGGRLAVAAGAMISVWDIRAKQVLYVLSNRPTTITDVAFSPDGKRLVSSDGAGDLKIWDVHTPTIPEPPFYVPKSNVNRLFSMFMSWTREIRTIKAHTTGINCLAFSKDGTSIAAVSSSIVKLWNAAESLDTLTLVGHKDFVNHVTFTRDGKRLVSASDDKTVRIWDVKTGKTLRTFLGHTKWVHGIAVDSRGKYLVSSASEGDEGNEGELKLWDLGTGKELRSHQGKVGNPVAFSPTQNLVASVGETWNDLPGAGQLPEALNLVKLWNPATGKTLTLLKGHTGPVYSLAFSSDGKFLATGSLDETVRIWETNTGRNTLTLKGHKASVLCVKFSPSGPYLASGAHDKSLKIWNLSTGKELFSLNGHKGGITDLDFSPDGARLLSVSQLGGAYK